MTVQLNIPDFRFEGVCRDKDPELFFPIGDTSKPGPAQTQANQAKAVCRTCPVMGQCLKWAMDTNQDAGVWGGMTESERRTHKRKKNRRQQEQVDVETQEVIAA